MFIPWKERQLYQEDRLYYISQKVPKLGSWGRYWYHKWHAAESWNLDSHMYAAYQIAQNYTIQSYTENTEKVPMFKCTWGCHYVILCQQYTLFKHLTPEMYAFAQKEFAMWVRHQDYYWQYDIPQSYEAFSHSIILYDYYHANVVDYIKEWELHRWNLLLSGKPSLSYARAIPESWWDIVLLPSIYESDLPHGLLLKNAIISDNVGKWIALLIPLHGHDKVFHLLKILNQKESLQDIQEFFERVLKEHGSEYYAMEYELQGPIKWLRSNTWYNHRQPEPESECDILI